MSPKEYFRNLFSRLAPQAEQGARQFGKDVGKKTYEKLVDSTANLIILVLFLIILLAGGYGIWRWLESKKERAENYVTRRISGQVVDETTDSSLADVWVAIPGEDGDTSRTDEGGYFTLTFKAHRDSTTVDIVFQKKGYVDKVKQNQDIPLNAVTEEYYNCFTLEPATLLD